MKGGTIRCEARRRIVVAYQTANLCLYTVLVVVEREEGVEVNIGKKGWGCGKDEKGS